MTKSQIVLLSEKTGTPLTPYILHTSSIWFKYGLLAPPYLEKLGQGH